jgi:hypothetical protein
MVAYYKKTHGIVFIHDCELDEWIGLEQTHKMTFEAMKCIIKHLSIQK